MAMMGRPNEDRAKLALSPVPRMLIAVSVLPVTVVVALARMQWHLKALDVFLPRIMVKPIDRGLSALSTR